MWESVAEAPVRTSRLKACQRVFMKPGAVGGEAAKDDARQLWRRWQRLRHRFDGDVRGTVRRKAIDAGGDCGKRHRREAVLAADLDRTAIAGDKQRVFVETSAIPHRA